MLPPISVPNPSGEPPAPIRDDSPAVEPPGQNLALYGFPVSPKIGLHPPKLKNKTIIIAQSNFNTQFIE